MNTKTCKKCGWVYPLITPYASCRFCGTRFTEGICTKCKEYSDDLVYNTSYCRSCYNKMAYQRQKGAKSTAEKHRRHYRRVCDEADRRFAEWVQKLKSIKTHTLTEGEWLEACRYFNGCALCGADDIAARGYFIRFEDGGTYTACNVIPLCDKCATDLKFQSNPFRRLNPQINRNLATSRGLSLERLNKVADYLQSKMGGRVDE